MIWKVLEDSDEFDYFWKIRKDLKQNWRYKLIRMAFSTLDDELSLLFENKSLRLVIMTIIERLAYNMLYCSRKLLL